MTNQRAILNPVELEICAEKLVKQLVRTTSMNDKQFIHMPMVYPNGDCVALQLISQEDGLFISDSGHAFRDSFLMNINHKYHDIALNVAKQYSVNVEEGTIFLHGLKQKELASSAIWVATASVKTVEALLNEERGGD